MSLLPYLPQLLLVATLLTLAWLGMYHEPRQRIASEIRTPPSVEAVRAGSTRGGQGSKDWTASAFDFMPVIVTLVILIAAIVLIFTRTQEDGSAKWAYGTVGSIVGYWLRTPSAKT